MRKFTIRLTVAGALAASILGASAGTASAATSHASIRITARPQPPRGDDEICTDWTNEDGTHGTNCPGGGWGWWKFGGDTNPTQEGVGDG